MTKVTATRKTSETQITAEVDLKGQGKSRVKTGIAYLDHMIEALSFHSLIDIELRAEGDLVHHVAEDVAIILGECLAKALGGRRGIRRFGSAMVPMDDSLAYASVDLAKRPYGVVDLKIEKEGVEDMVREDITHFLSSLSTSLNANIHVNVQYGSNDHHKVEAAFKALALSLREAISQDPRRRGSPSSKGVM